MQNLFDYLMDKKIAIHIGRNPNRSLLQKIQENIENFTSIQGCDIGRVSDMAIELYKEDSCLNIQCNHFYYCDTNWYRSHGYNIIELSDLMNELLYKQNKLNKQWMKLIE